MKSINRTKQVKVPAIPSVIIMNHIASLQTSIHTTIHIPENILTKQKFILVSRKQKHKQKTFGFSIFAQTARWRLVGHNSGTLCLYRVHYLPVYISSVNVYILTRFGSTASVTSTIAYSIVRQIQENSKLVLYHQVTALSNVPSTHKTAKNARKFKSS